MHFCCNMGHRCYPSERDCLHSSSQVVPTLTRHKGPPASSQMSVGRRVIIVCHTRSKRSSDHNSASLVMAFHCFCVSHLYVVIVLPALRGPILPCDEVFNLPSVVAVAACEDLASEFERSSANESSGFGVEGAAGTDVKGCVTQPPSTSVVGSVGGLPSSPCV